MTISLIFWYIPCTYQVFTTSTCDIIRMSYIWFIPSICLVYSMMAYVWYILTLHCTQPPHAEATKLLSPRHEGAGYIPSLYHDLSGQLFGSFCCPAELQF